MAELGLVLGVDIGRTGGSALLTPEDDLVDAVGPAPHNPNGLPRWELAKIGTRFGSASVPRRDRCPVRVMAATTRVSVGGMSGSETSYGGASTASQATGSASANSVGGYGPGTSNGEPGVGNSPNNGCGS